MEKKERNAKVKKIYIDDANYNIDETVKIIEKIPELAKEFNGKSIRRSCMGILQSLQVWRKMEKVEKPKEQELTKKELALIFCEALEINLASIPTFLNLKKVDICLLIEAMTAYVEIEQIDEVKSIIEKKKEVK